MITKENICNSVNYEEVSSAAIGELERPLTKVIGQILRDKKEYDLILGDDTGGRIPTLIVARAINTLRGLEGKNKVPVRFAYNNFDQAEEFKDILKKLGRTPNRVLLITEFISTGGTVLDIGKFFMDVGKGAIKLDIASVDTRYNKKAYKYKSSYVGAISSYFGAIYVGDQSGATPSIYNHSFGLRRHTTRDNRVIKGNPAFKDVFLARKDVKIVADRIVQNLQTQGFWSRFLNLAKSVTVK